MSVCLYDMCFDMCVFLCVYLCVREFERSKCVIS